MLLNDGIVTLCKLTDVSEEGAMPSLKLVPQNRAYYGLKTAGVTRVYLAKEMGNRLDMLIEIPRQEITAADYYCMINGEQFRILQVQPVLNEDGLKMADLALQRLEEVYNVAADST